MNKVGAIVYFYKYKYLLVRAYKNL